MKFNSDFRYDLEVGKTGEKVVAEILEGDTTEVKSEIDIWKETRNVFIEFHSRDKLSGIATTESKWWSTNFYYKGELEFNITLLTEKLRKMVKEKNKYRIVEGGDNNTSKGFLVPIEDLIK